MPGGDLQQGRLAGAVAADQADPLAGADREVAPVSSGVPPKVSAISLSWISGGAILGLSRALLAADRLVQRREERRAVGRLERGAGRR